MQIKFYKFSGDPRTVNKANLLQEVVIKQCNVYGDNVLQTPSIEVVYDSSLMGCNYMYIADFNRYYYIGSIDLVTGNKLILNGNVDLLMSNASDIMNSRGLISRGSNGNKYIADPLAKQTERTTFQYRTLGTCFQPSVTYCIVKGR